MANNMYINTTGLELEKDIPALMGMDFSNVAKPPMKLDVGRVITDFTNKTISAKQQVEYTRIKNELNDEYNKWAIDNLTDPNAFTNRERRVEITRSYNDLLERQKTRLAIAKNGLNAPQFEELERTFKQSTFDSLYKIQNQMNTGYVQETLAGASLQVNSLIMNCANTSDMSVINDNLDTAWKLYGALDSLGIDTRKMRADTFETIQSNYMDTVIESGIINNLEDESFAYIDPKTNKPMRDAEGNLIMNNSKKMKAVTDRKNYLLSEQAIKPDAEEYSKKNNIPYNDAYNLIYNARNKFWKLRLSNYESLLSSREVQSQNKIIQFEQKLNNEVTERINQLQDNISSNENIIDISRIAFNNNTLGYNNLYEPRVMATLTDNRYESIKDVYDKNMYFDMLPKGSIGVIKNTYDTIDSPETAEQFSAIVKGYVNGTNNEYKDDNIYRNSMFASIQNKTNIPAGTLMYMSKDNLKDLATEKILASKAVGNINLQEVKLSYGNRPTPFSTDPMDSTWVKSSIQMIINNPDKYLLGKQSASFNVHNNVEKVNDILSLYNSDKNIKDMIDNIVGHNKNMARRNMLAPYNLNARKGSTLYNATKLYTSENYRLENIEKVKDYGDIITNIIKKSSGEVDRINEMKGLVDSKYNLFMSNEYMLGGEDRPDILANPYFREKFTPEVIERLENGTMDIYSIPMEFIDGNVELEKYYQKLYEEKRNKRLSK